MIPVSILHSSKIAVLIMSLMFSSGYFLLISSSAFNSRCVKNTFTLLTVCFFMVISFLVKVYD